jgi:uncharacterized tellurite resistance protein B-like protein
MDIFKNIFGTDINGIRRSHVKNLIAIALADGQLTSEEWDLMVYIASTMGIDEKGIENIKKNPDVVNFMAPKNHEDRVQQIEDLIAVLTIDHDINPKEVELCRKISLKLDVLPQIVDDIIAKRFLPKN